MIPIIKHNIPLPEPTKIIRFPWSKMKVGDSFEFPYDQLNSLVSSWGYFRKTKKPSWKFTSRKQDNGTGRVWRVK